MQQIKSPLITQKLVEPQFDWPNLNFPIRDQKINFKTGWNEAFALRANQAEQNM